MASYIYWFLLALGMLMVEMATGTFYMLVLSIALAVGGVAALLGLDVPLQIMLGAAAGITGIFFLRRAKAAKPARASDQNFDIGQPVYGITWREDGTARVNFRGAEWDAEPASPDTPRETTMYIKAMRGSTLILTQHKS